MKDRCIQITRISVGWIDGIIQDKHTKIYFSNSYMDNFLDDFMLAFLTVLNEYPADEHKETFRATIEPASAKWNFSLVGQDIHIHEIVYESYNDPETILSDKTVILNKDVFLQDFIAEMESVLQRYGLFGYRMEWESEFPLSLFLKIKDIASGKNDLRLSVINPGADNKGIEITGSDFSVECGIMKDT